MQPFRFDLCELPGETEGLREEIRAFLAEELKHVPKVTRAQTWSGSDTEFSRKMGAKGWIGMTWPKKYGGHERSFFERYVMLEEMLAAGAPVGAHWIGDRQSGPLLLRFGTEEQRQKILPRVVKGECHFRPLYTSDAADEPLCVDPGGRRITTNKNAEHVGHFLVQYVDAISVLHDTH